MEKLRALEIEVAIALKKYNDTNCKLQKEYFWSEICRLGVLIDMEEAKINDPNLKILKVESSFDWSKIPFSQNEAIEKLGAYA